jgi:hypothetical protein
MNIGMPTAASTAARGRSVLRGRGADGASISAAVIENLQVVID